LESSLVAGRLGKKEYRFRIDWGRMSTPSQFHFQSPVAYVNLIGDKGVSGERPLSHATLLPPSNAPEPPRPGGAASMRARARRNVLGPDAATRAHAKGLGTKFNAENSQVKGGNGLGPGRRSTFSILSHDVGRLQALQVRIHRGAGAGGGGDGGWFLERCLCWLPKDVGEARTDAQHSAADVLQVPREREKVVFPCYAWFGLDMGEEGILQTLKPVGARAREKRHSETRGRALDAVSERRDFLEDEGERRRGEGEDKEDGDAAQFAEDGDDAQFAEDGDDPHLICERKLEEEAEQDGPEERGQGLEGGREGGGVRVGGGGGGKVEEEAVLTLRLMRLAEEASKSLGAAERFEKARIEALRCTAVCTLLSKQHEASSQKSAS
jgi:hypothetical protein